MRTSVVVPVRGMGHLLQECLGSLEAQTSSPDEVIVVDDAPSPSLPTDQRYRVVHSGGVGPYTARNLGWRAASGEMVLFLDARSRPRPTWAQQLGALLDRKGVGLAGCDVSVVPGSSLASKVAALEQPFAVDSYVSRAWFRPYLPTCSLGVRREALEQVDGFAATRSGGDADLCWRVQEHGWRLEATSEVLMDWVPRDGYRDYLEQHYRYGRSNTHLRREWAGRGAQQVTVPSVSTVARMAGTAVLRAGYGLARGRQDRVHYSLLEGARVATRLGVRRAAAEAAR